MRPSTISKKLASVTLVVVLAASSLPLPAIAYAEGSADVRAAQYQATVPLVGEGASAVDELPLGEDPSASTSGKDYSEDGFEIVYEDALDDSEADLVDESFVPEMDMQAADDFVRPISATAFSLEEPVARSADAVAPQSATSSNGKMYKDISAVELYTLVDGQVQATETLPSGSYDDYLAYVESAYAPGFYASVISASANSVTVREPFGGELTLPFPLIQPSGDDAPPSFLASLESVAGYRADRAIAYANVLELSPFLEGSAVISAGNALSGDLASKPIQAVLSFDADGKMVDCADTQAARVKIVFQDRTVLDAAVSGESIDADGASAPYAYRGYSLGSSNSAVERVSAHIGSSVYLEYFSAFADVSLDNRVQREYWVNNVQANADWVARDILANSSMLVATAPDNKVYAALLEKSLGTEGAPADLKMMALLYTYNYIQRWYDFEVEEIHVADILLHGGAYYGEACTLDDLAARFAVSQSSQRKGQQTQITYAQLIYPCLRQDASIANVKGFVEDLVDVFSDFETADDWFIYEYNKAGVVEEGQPDEDGFIWRAWTTLSKDGTVGYVRNGQRRILPFLTLPDYSYYAFSLPSVFSYGSPYMYYTDPTTPENQEKLRERVKKNQQLQLNYIQTIVGFTGRKDMWNAMMFLDQDKQCINAWTTPWQAWWGENGCTEANATQDPMIKGFYEVLQLPPPSGGSAACGGNEIVRWRCNAKLDDFLVWSHEFGHCIDEKILCGGSTRKDVAECYTFGMLEQGLSSTAFGLNIAYDYPWENAYSMNASFKSLSTSDSAKQFYGGLFELIDILDYLELKAFLRLSTADQQAVATQLWYGGDNRMNGDYGGPTFILYDPASVSKFASGMNVYVSDEAKADIEADGEAVRHFDTIEEVFDHRVCLIPNVTATSHPEWGPSAYGRDTILSRWWYLPHHNNGGSATAVYKSLSFRMAGEDGYRGFQLMLAGNWNDTLALRYATGKQDFKQYKLDTYAEIDEKLDELKWIDAAELEERYLAAFKSAAAKGDRSLTEANNIRLQTFALMKRLTRDFDDTLFSPSTQEIHISSADDLAKIVDNPCGAFVLDDDITVTAEQAATYLVDANFRGFFDGQGHTIKGDYLPALFREADRATIQNLNIYDSSTSSIAVKSTNLCLLDVDIAVRDTSVTISNVEEFLAIANDPAADYRIIADIDFSEHSVGTAGSALITADFTGTLSGEGHVLSGLNNASLFTKFKGEARDLQIRDFCNMRTNGDYIAAFAKILSGATVENVSFSNIELSGLYRTAVLAGHDDAPSTISRISVVNSKVTGQDKGCYNSLLVGRKNGGTMTDVYVQGELICQGTDNGGVCGSAKSTVFTRCISDADITKLESATESRIFSAGFLGNLDGGAVTAKQCAFTGTITGDCYAFTGATDSYKRYFTNCYEIEDAGGISSVYGTNIVSLAHDDAVTQMHWDGLGYQQGLWSYASVSSGTPMLVFSGKAWDITMTIDYVGETMTFRGEDAENLNIDGLWGVTEGMTSVSLTQALDTDEWDHQVMVTRADDGEHGVAYSLEITVPERPAAPEVIAVPAPGDGERDRAQVTFPLGRSYQYRSLDSTSGWVTVPDAWRGDPMSTRPCVMEIRCPAVTGQSFVSKVTTVDLRYNSGSTPTRSLLTFETNGGQLDDPPTAYTEGSTLELPVPTREGYLFDGWHDNEGLLGAAIDEITPADTGDKTFWAKWVPRTYSVTLEKGEGSLKPGASDLTSYTYGEGATLPELERPGYEFGGWYGDADLSGASITAIGVTDTGDKSFWAKWTPCINHVIYDMGTDSSGNVPPSIGLSAYGQYHTGTTLLLPTSAVMVWEGHTFVGWYRDAALSVGPVTEVTAGEYGDVTFYAKWAGEACRIDYRTNEGSFVSDPETFYEFGVDGLDPGSEVALPTADDITRTGYIFDGWYESDSFEGAPLTTIVLKNGVISLWAKWSVASYSIDYELNGGSWAPGFVPGGSYTIESEDIGLPVSPSVVRIGHTFDGWYDNAALAGEPVAKIAAGSVGDRSFWAKWNANTYSVTLEKNHGSLKPGASDLTSYTYGEGATLPELERPGYEFGGWYGDADLEGEPITAIDATDTGDRTLWAKWVPCTYAITYHMGADGNGNIAPSIDLSAFDSYQTGETFVLPGSDVMVWEDHTFAGWYEDESLSGQPVIQIASGEYGDVAFYAKWVGDACKIDYHLNDGSFIIQPETVFEFGVDGHEEGNQIDLPPSDDVHRAGYSFEGWYENSDLEGDPVTSITLKKGSIQLHAKWSLVTYAIEYELNGGAWIEGFSPIESYTVHSGDIELPAYDSVEREGFAFAGWYDDAEFSHVPVAEIASGDTGDKTFWGKWEEIAPDDGDDGGDPVDPPDGGDEPDDPDEGDDSRLKIIALEFDGLGDKAIQWDENGYARIEVPRSKMPTKAEDFTLQLPEGVEHAITKRAPSLAFRIAEILGAYDGVASEIWDIELWYDSLSRARITKTYSLEIVPTDDGEAPVVPPEDTEDPGDSGNAGGNAGDAGNGNISGDDPADEGPDRTHVQTGGNATNAGELPDTGDGIGTTLVALCGIVLLAAGASFTVINHRSRKRK